MEQNWRRAKGGLLSSRSSLTNWKKFRVYCRALGENDILFFKSRVVRGRPAVFQRIQAETKIDEQGTEFRSGVALLIHLVFVSSKEKNLTRREKSVFEINSITCKVERKLFLHCLTNLGPAVVDQVQPQNNYGVL